MKPPRPTAALLLFVIAAAGLAAVQVAEETAADLRRRSQAALAQIAGDLAVPGLEQPVEVIRDRWGVPQARPLHLARLRILTAYPPAQASKR